MEAATFVKNGGESAGKVLLVLSNQEAQIIQEALEIHANTNKRKKNIKKLSSEFNSMVECY